MNTTILRIFVFDTTAITPAQLQQELQRLRREVADQGLKPSSWVFNGNALYMLERIPCIHYIPDGFAPRELLGLPLEVRQDQPLLPTLGLVVVMG